MFDTALNAPNRGRGVRRKLATLPAALAVHALALGLVMAGQLWAVDQVPEVISVPPLMVHILPPPGGGGDSHATGHHARRTTVAQVHHPVAVQPSDVPKDVPKNTGAETPTSGTVPFSERQGPDTGGGDDRPPGGESGPGVEEGDDVPDAVGPIHVGGNVIAPVPVSRPSPRYPEVARRLGVHGTVSLEAVIDEEGNVTNVRVVADPGYGCGQAALDAVRMWRYRPATLNGRAVAVFLTISVVFQLTGAE
ncbi:MAG TPA: TonB family protein [Thermoanaerobaculaceae bacterium]|nr:TonB family protein [Thermoanaerobaculaceae bacterium]